MAGRGKTHTKLVEEVGSEVVRFQEASTAVDAAAAALLGVDQRDLPCLTLLLFAGPTTVTAITGAIGLGLAAARNALARLELAGYVQRDVENAGAWTVTAHAYGWIARVWEPLRASGPAVLGKYSLRQLRLVIEVLRKATAIQEAHAARLRRQLDSPRGRQPGHSRGGLSPAARRRVELFIESNLQHPLRAVDMARRAELSIAHFSRAFRASTAMTPRTYLEHRRLARARQLVEGSDRSLADIAAATGFGTQSRMTAAFRRRIGFTPGVLRRARQHPPRPTNRS
jgi:AraC family transcriptional regulator